MVEIDRFEKVRKLMYTQCPDCNTAFRVTADVLKQAAGKVRCGGKTGPCSGGEIFAIAGHVAHLTLGAGVGDEVVILGTGKEGGVAAMVLTVAGLLETGMSDLDRVLMLAPIDQVQADFGIRTFAIVTIEEVVDYLHNREIDGKVVVNDDMKDKIAEYRLKYGA